MINIPIKFFVLSMFFIFKSKNSLKIKINNNDTNAIIIGAYPFFSPFLSRYPAIKVAPIAPMDPA